MPAVGLVVIGRNEGARLERCLASAAPHIGRAVYVDSGSTDHSVPMARARGIDVVELDTSVPFTAARARNAGFARLLEIAPGTELVQFVDGDCEILDSWWDSAARRLLDRPELAIVCGRRRERFPDASAYNRLCDVEWDTPVGPADACGGDFLCRAVAFQQVHGFDPAFIAGEEPEMCLRLRAKGWQIERLGVDMTLHDAAMTSWRQWWKREKRSGYAVADGRATHGRSPERYRVKMYRSNYAWGLLLPLLALAPAWWTYGLSAVLLLMYPLQYLRLRRSLARGRNLSSADASLYARFVLLGKFPQSAGQLKYTLDHLLKRPKVLIEYKSAEAPPSTTPPASAF
ncbi:MAG: glycosyltransferase family 2 protein [Phycisphaerae bacterium]